MSNTTNRKTSKKRESSRDFEPRKKRAKTDAPQPVSCKQTNAQLSSGDDDGGFLRDIKVFVLQAGLGKARADIFSKQVKRYGGAVHDKITDETTHVIVDEQMEIDRMLRILKMDTPPTNVRFAKANWLSNCLSEREVISLGDFELGIEKFIKVQQKTQETPKEKNSEVKGEVSDDAKKDAVAMETKVKDEAVPGTSMSNIQSSKEDRDDTTSNAKSVHSADGQVFAPVRRYDSDDSSYEPSDDDDYASTLSTSGVSSATSTPNTSPQKLPKGNWVCSKAVSKKPINHNKHITDKLELLMETYKNTNDQWRALGYSKAIMALKNYPKEVTSWEEANEIPGIGKKMADKVWEIVQSGHLRKLDHVCQGEDVATINLFNKIHGVGPTVARDFYQQGFRTIDDLREKAKLSKQQKIGIKHFEDFLDRMPREEAAEIEKVVVDMVHSINPGLIAMACGSYRRGKPNCGDVDVLVTHPDGHSHKGVFQKILAGLRATGFLTDDLVSHEDSGEQKKYLGVCKLPGENRKYRRLDIIVVPYHEYPCAIMYFTGSSHFNRSMRSLAGKKGMSLNEHALKSGIIRRGREKINEGLSIPVKSEEDIFRILGLEYRTPEERDW